MSDFKSSPNQTGGSVTFGDASGDSHKVTGSLTLHGPISSSYGGTFVQGVIANTYAASSSISGNAAIQGHSLAIQAGATITGSSIHHGALDIRLAPQGGALTVGKKASGLGSTAGIISSSGGFMVSKNYIAPARDLASIDTTAGDVAGTNNDYTGSLITKRSGQVTYTIGVALSASGDGASGITGFMDDGGTVFDETSNVILNIVDHTGYGATGGGTTGGENIKISVGPWFTTYDDSTFNCLFKFENVTGAEIAVDKTFVVNFTFF